jgi:hypothetical protein
VALGVPQEVVSAILVLALGPAPKLVPFFCLFSGQDRLEFDSAGGLAFFAFG